MLINASFLIAIAAVAVVLMGWFTWGAIETKPLGNDNKLEYIGKENYGCWLICDSNPASIYYYATDMSQQEVATYFKKARLYRPIEADLDSTRIWLIHDNQDFIVSYYQNEPHTRARGLAATAKHVVSIPSFNYQKAKDSL